MLLTSVDKNTLILCRCENDLLFFIKSFKCFHISSGFKLSIQVAKFQVDKNTQKNIKIHKKETNNDLMSTKNKKKINLYTLQNACHDTRQWHCSKY